MIAFTYQPDLQTRLIARPDLYIFSCKQSQTINPGLQSDFTVWLRPWVQISHQNCCVLPCEYDALFFLFLKPAFFYLQLYTTYKHLVIAIVVSLASYSTLGHRQLTSLMFFHQNAQQQKKSFNYKILRLLPCGPGMATVLISCMYLRETNVLPEPDYTGGKTIKSLYTWTIYHVKNLLNTLSSCGKGWGWGGGGRGVLSPMYTSVHTSAG